MLKTETDEDLPATFRPGRLKSLVAGMMSVVVAAGLIVVGLSVIENRAVAVSGSDQESPITVSTLIAEPATGYVRKSRHIGLVEPKRQVDLRFENSGTVSDVFVEEGQRVSAGQLLARLDIRSLQAQRSAQIAVRTATVSDLERASLVLKRQRSLEVRDFTDGQSLDDARLAVERAQALIEQADAIITSIDVLIDKSELRAPFNAIVGQQPVDRGATVGPATTIARLFDADAPMVRIGVPIDSSSSLQERGAYSLRIDGNEYPARLISKRQDVSVLTRTLDARFELDLGNRPRPVYGETAELVIPEVVVEDGYRLPVSALTEGENGLWSVMLAIPDSTESAQGDSTMPSRVERKHVSVLYTDGAEAYVKAELSERAIVIQAGPHRVVSGQRVQVAGVDP